MVSTVEFSLALRSHDLLLSKLFRQSVSQSPSTILSSPQPTLSISLPKLSYNIKA